MEFQIKMVADGIHEGAEGYHKKTLIADKKGFDAFLKSKRAILIMKGNTRYFSGIKGFNRRALYRIK